MTKENRKNSIEGLFQQMYNSTDAEEIKTLMQNVANEVNTAGYAPVHQEVIPMTVQVGGTDITERLIANIGKEMSGKDRQMISYQMGQIRNLIDSSLLPDQEDEK